MESDSKPSEGPVCRERLRRKAERYALRATIALAKSASCLPPGDPERNDLERLQADAEDAHARLVRRRSPYSGALLVHE